MPKILQTDNKEKISLITDFIHDCRFDKATIVFDDQLMLLEIPFCRETWEKKRKVKEFFIIKKYDVPIMEYTLKIQHADDYQIMEGNQKGPGSEDFFNEIRFDSDKNELWISTIIAKGIKIKIRKLDLWVEDTEKVLKEVSRFSVF